MKPTRILVTGLPGCGKSTLIEKVVGRLKRPVIGFMTREIRKDGVRVGFSIDTFDGKKGILAHVRFESPFRVGRYGVDLHTLKQIAVPSLLEVSGPEVLVVIDEIGKMECLSPVFRETLVAILDSPNQVLGSIAQKGDAFIRSIKSRKDVSVISMTNDNRDLLVASLVDILSASPVDEDTARNEDA